MPKCTTCQIEIERHYCSNCGKRYVGKRLNMPTLLADFFDNFFAMDNSFLSQMWVMLKDPKKVVQDYWDGYRRFYFSPNRVLLIGTLVLGLNFLMTENSFLGVTVSSSESFLSVTFVLFVSLIPFLTLSSWLAYFKFKKNGYEHLVLNIYTFSFWIILFSLFSFSMYFLDLGWFEYTGQIMFLILIFIWNSRVFTLTPAQRIGYCILNCLIFIVILVGILFLKGDLSLPKF